MSPGFPAFSAHTCSRQQSWEAWGRGYAREAFMRQSKLASNFQWLCIPSGVCEHHRVNLTSWFMYTYMLHVPDRTCNRFVGSRIGGLLKVKTNLPTSLYGGQYFSMSPATGNTLYTHLLLSVFQSKSVYIEKVWISPVGCALHGAVLVLVLQTLRLCI